MTRGRGQVRKRAKSEQGAEAVGALERAMAVASALVDLKAGDVKVLDVRGLTSVTDMMVLATSTGERHLKALAGGAREAVREEGGTVLGSEGTGPAGWIVVDAGDVVVHLFTRELRAYYDLDGLWSDASASEPETGRGREEA